MTNRDVFKIWAPNSCLWVDWVRPVHFLDINDDTPTKDVPACQSNWCKELETDVAVILDSPAADSVYQCLAFASVGYRPILLHNGTNPQQGTLGIVDNNELPSALVSAGIELSKMKINSDAPPVFLLDSNRTHRHKMNVSTFDNSWDIYFQDMPTAEFLLKNGIQRVVVLHTRVQRDLKLVLYKYQQKGIQILLTDGFASPSLVHIKKPPRKIRF